MRKIHVGRELFTFLNSAHQWGKSSMDLVSEEGLKREAGEFDLTAILFLDLSDRGLLSLGSLPQCSQLRILNLSCNQLTSATALGSLSNLEQLDLSANQIASLDGLEKLGALRRLDLPGNCVSQLEALLPLAGLAHLKNLSLKLPGTELTNPVCSAPSYETFMLETFPLLLWLDGEKVLGPGSEFYSRCKELDREHANGGHNGGMEEVKSSLEALEDPLANFSLNDEQASKTITKLLSECSDMSEQTQRHIAALRELAQT